MWTAEKTVKEFSNDKETCFTGNSGKDAGFGGNVSFDYLLPIGIPLSLGTDETIDIKFTRFLTAGISIKLGKPKR